MKPDVLTRWTCEQSAELYGIRNWGARYFDVSTDGHILVKPFGPGSPVRVDLLKIVQDLQRRDCNPPIVLRFADILASQLQLIYDSFNLAIQSAGYQGIYRGVYPVKVNQKQMLIDDIIEYGAPYGHGLEAGSKAELIAAVASMRNPDAFIVCNGYKDEEFLGLALQSLKMGLKTYIVMEMPSELGLILALSKSMGVRPLLGIRTKLSSRSGGHWDGSGGDRSKFGMDSNQITEMVDQLRQADMLDCLQLLHYHLGSQIPDIRRVRTALQEACQFYIGLVREGAPMGILNIGGGLAVDYDGSHTNFASSRNYTVNEYAADVVEVIMNSLNGTGIRHPTILSESGRATVAHHSVLIFNVLHVRRFEPHHLPDPLPEPQNEMLRNLLTVLQTLSPRNAQEAYHDAVFYRDELRSAFIQGRASLRERALAENLFWQIVRQIANSFEINKYVPDELENLDRAIADVYYGNFSLFQSIPDSWAVDQLFPVVPLHRLDEHPTREAVIADITCDSDGKIDTFIDLRDVRHTLPLHELNGNEYYLGVFMVGAYQETLGDMHNLFGTTNVVHIRVQPDGTLKYVREVPGESVEQVLSYVEFNPDTLMKHITQKADDALRSGRITAMDRERIMEAYSAGMTGYTYFEK